MISPDSTTSLCRRVESARPNSKGGWFHRLIDVPYRPRGPRRITLSSHACDASDAADLARRLHEYGRDCHELRRLADKLGVKFDSMLRLGVGWCASGRYSSWPLHDELGRVIGINRRFPDGSKKVMYDHRSGLYLPKDLPHELADTPLLITDGGSDTAAALEMGFTTVGRFSCDQHVRMLVKLVLRLRACNVVIIADNDGPGLGGAASLASTLRVYAKVVKVITPPEDFKDLRAWHQAGARGEDLAAAIADAPSQRAVIEARYPGGQA